MISAMSMSQRTDNSYAFLMRPFRLLEYVTCLLVGFSIFLISNFTLPIVATVCLNYFLAKRPAPGSTKNKASLLSLLTVKSLGLKMQPNFTQTRAARQEPQENRQSSALASEPGPAFQTEAHETVQKAFRLSNVQPRQGDSRVRTKSRNSKYKRADRNGRRNSSLGAREREQHGVCEE